MDIYIIKEAHRINLYYFNGACQVRKFGQKTRKEETENNGGKEGAPKTFPSLFWRQFDKRGATEKKSKEICGYIVTDY